jgi:hypothetical protein
MIVRVRGDEHIDPDLGTIPTIAREHGLHPKVLRRAVHAGKVPAYDVGTAWPRVRRSEIRTWIASTRISPSSHAAARLREVLEREDRARTP